MVPRLLPLRRPQPGNEARLAEGADDMAIKIDYSDAVRLTEVHVNASMSKQGDLDTFGFTLDDGDPRPALDLTQGFVLG